MKNEKMLIRRISGENITNDLNLGSIKAHWLNFFEQKSWEVMFIFSSYCPNSFGITHY